jgi:hypothetical protein
MTRWKTQPNHVIRPDGSVLETDMEKLAAESGRLADAMRERITAHLQALADDLERTFREVDPEARQRVFTAGPPDPRAKYWFARTSLAWCPSSC